MKLEGRCRSPSLPGTGRGAREAVGGVRITSPTAQREAMTEPRGPPRHRLRNGKFAGNWVARSSSRTIVDSWALRFVGRIPTHATRSPLPVPGGMASSINRGDNDPSSACSKAPRSSGTHQGNESIADSPTRSKYGQPDRYAADGLEAAQVCGFMESLVYYGPADAPVSMSRWAARTD